MKNKACIIIDNCSDCPYMCRSYYPSMDDGLDSWFCEYHDGIPVLIAEGLSVDDEPHVEIPNWCPIKLEILFIKSPKPFKLYANQKKENQQ